MKIIETEVKEVPRRSKARWGKLAGRNRAETDKGRVPFDESL